MNVFNITLGYASEGSIFSQKNKELWNKMRRSAIGKGAFLLKMKVRKAFESAMPSAARTFTKSKAPNGQKWKGKLSDAVQQGKVDMYEFYGETDVHIKGTRQTQSGSWIGLFYEAGTDSGRYGKKTTGRGKNKKKNSNYHYRGNLQGYHYLSKGSNGFEFSTTVEDILKRYIDELS